MVVKSYCKKLEVNREFVARAYDNWLKNDAGRKNEWRVWREYGSPDALIDEITREAVDGTLSFKKLETKPRCDSTKVRDIGIECVKQQVCGYVVDLAIEDLMRAKMGFWQVAAKGKSQFRAARAARRWLRRCKYHGHLDVRKCYDSIKCSVVMRVLRKYVRNDVVLGICKAIMDSYPDGHLMIGSYFSMRMAQLIMSFAYHYIEQLGKVRRRRFRALVSHQIVYADDMWLFSNDKRDLEAAIRKLERYMLSEFGLEIKPWKVCVSGEDEPADIAGAVTRPERVTVRSTTFLRGRRALMRFRRKPTSLNLARRLLSYFGWFKNTNCISFCIENGVYAAVSAAKALVSEHDRRLCKCQS